MNPALILFGIQSVIRLGRITNDALEQWARDDEAIFPEIKEPDLNREVFVNAFFNQPEYNYYVVGDAAPLAEYWNDPAVKPEKTAIREVKEETNLSIELTGKLIDVFTYFDRRNKRETVVITYECVKPKGKIKMDIAHIECQWIKKNNWKKFK